MPPSISVVVTCFNYGHFLPACLDSLDSQTCKADQVIVVDDGSQDASRSIAQRENVILVEKTNGGQASAFNAGFSRASGDVVIFLDADDTLLHDALELVGLTWHESFAAVSFGMNLIDGAGRLCGHYEIEPRDGDMRPELLGRGYFDFMPTSGNAFNSRMLRSIFPLSEPRWRISADTVLLRAAALAGPIRQLPFVLANYRTHGGNSYHRSLMPRLQSAQRALNDMIDANVATARLGTGTQVFGPDAGAVRLSLLLAAFRLSFLSIDNRNTAADRSRGNAFAMIARIMPLSIGFRAKAAYSLVFMLLALLAPISPRMRRWVALPETRPQIVARLLSLIVGSRLEQQRRRGQSARRSDALQSGIDVDCTQEGGVYLNEFDWRYHRQDGRRLLYSRVGNVHVPVAHCPYGATLELDLRRNPHDSVVPIFVSVLANGKRVHEGEISDGGMISFILETADTVADTALKLQISAIPVAASFIARSALLFRPAASVELRYIGLQPLTKGTQGCLLANGTFYRYADIAEACQLSPVLKPGADARTIETARLVLAFVRPRMSGTNELVLRFASTQPQGILVASDASEITYKAEIGPNSVRRIPVRPRLFAQDSDLVLTLDFDPADAFETAVFNIESIGLSRTNSGLDRVAQAYFPSIGAGVIHTFADGTGRNILTENWAVGESGAELFDTVGLIQFTVDPDSAPDTTLHLRVAPVSLPLKTAC